MPYRSKYFCSHFLNLFFGLFLSLSFLLLIACSAERPENLRSASFAADMPQGRSAALESEAASQLAPEQAAPGQAAAQDIAGAVEAKLLKEGYITFETKDLSKTRESIFAAVKKHRGYISSDREYSSNSGINNGGQNTANNTLMIRVPASNFDALLADATQGVEQFDEKQSNTRDVTEEFLDIQSRLKVKRELETRYLALLEKAETVSDILEIEKQMGTLREEMESIEGRLKYLQNRVSFSTLTITFYENLSSTDAEAGIWQQLKDGFKNGLKNFMRFLILLDNIWPFVLIGLIVIFGTHSYKKKKTSKNKAFHKKKYLRKRSHSEASPQDKS